MSSAVTIINTGHEVRTCSMESPVVVDVISAEIENGPDYRCVCRGRGCIMLTLLRQNARPTTILGDAGLDTNKLSTVEYCCSKKIPL